MQCLSCGRTFPAKIDGEIEPNGLMLCRGCGHVMAWTSELTLRELTAAEQAEAGSNLALMHERRKILPAPPSPYPLTSWALAGLMLLILAMATGERLGYVGLLHPR